MSYTAAFRNAMHQEPIIVWSCIIGGIGEKRVVFPQISFSCFYKEGAFLFFSVDGT